MSVGKKRGFLLFASLLFGTFGAHALYRARADTGGGWGAPPQSGLLAASVAGPIAQLGAALGANDSPPADSADGRVHLTLRSDRDAVLQRSDGAVNVEVSISADALSGPTERTPTDLVVVMDHSG